MLLFTTDVSIRRRVVKLQVRSAPLGLTAKQFSSRERERERERKRERKRERCRGGRPTGVFNVTTPGFNQGGW
jgi:hypothetical protein